MHSGQIIARMLRSIKKSAGCEDKTRGQDSPPPSHVHGNGRLSARYSGIPWSSRRSGNTDDAAELPTDVADAVAWFPAAAAPEA